MGKRRSQNSMCSWIFRVAGELHACLHIEMREGGSQRGSLFQFAEWLCHAEAGTPREQSLQTAVREIEGSIWRRLNFPVCMELSNGHLNIYVGSKMTPELGREPTDSLIQQILRECVSWAPRRVSVPGIQWLSERSQGLMEPTQYWRRQSINY